jgi:hypothetical protein
MLTVYRAFRAAVTFALLAVFLALFAAVAIDFAADHGVLVGLANNMDDEGWSPITIAESIGGFWPGLLFVIGLAGGMWLDAGFRGLNRWSAARAKSGPLEILYDPNDHRFVHREFRDGQLKATTCVAIAIHNAMGDKAVHDVGVSVGRNAFFNSMVGPLWGDPTRRIAQIAPNATEFVELFVLPEGAASMPVSMLGKVQRLVVRVRSKDARGTSARFVFNAQAAPALRRVS